MRIETTRGGGSAALGAGLLVADQEAANAAKPQERRIEEWIVSNLERNPGKSAWLWDQVLGKRAGMSRRSRKEELQAAKDGDWGRFRLVDRQGTALLRLSDSMLLKEQVIQEFSDDLIELIGAGYERVILNFQDVERLSVQIAMGLVEAQLQCASRHGGRLKACGLRPDLAEAFALTGLDEEIEIHPDEKSALESDWPELDEFRPLPVNILSVLRIFNEVDDRGGMPPMKLDQAATEVPVRLIFGSDRTVTLHDQPLTIGRDPSCRIRVSSANVSRMHASIERKDGQVLLTDHQSTNGTQVNGRRVSGAAVELNDGDAVVVGSLRFSVRFGEPDRSTDETSSDFGDRFREGDSDDRSRTAEDLPVPTAEDSERQRMLDVQVLQGILVLTPLHSRLDDETRIAPLRAELQSLGGKNPLRRVVVDLRHVAHLSSGAIGLLVAHALKLEREGGEIRLSQVSPRVMTVLNQVRLPMLMEIHPTTDEAVLVSWRSAG